MKQKSFWGKLLQLILIQIGMHRNMNALPLLWLNKSVICVPITIWILFSPCFQWNYSSTFNNKGSNKSCSDWKLFSSTCWFYLKWPQRTHKLLLSFISKKHKCYSLNKRGWGSSSALLKFQSLHSKHVVHICKFRRLCQKHSVSVQTALWNHKTVRGKESATSMHQS